MNQVGRCTTFFLNIFKCYVVDAISEFSGFRSFGRFYCFYFRKSQKVQSAQHSKYFLQMSSLRILYTDSLKNFMKNNNEKSAQSCNETNDFISFRIVVHTPEKSSTQLFETNVERHMSNKKCKPFMMSVDNELFSLVLVQSQKNEDKQTKILSVSVFYCKPRSKCICQLRHVFEICLFGFESSVSNDNSYTSLKHVLDKLGLVFDNQKRDCLLRFQPTFVVEIRDFSF